PASSKANGRRRYAGRLLSPADTWTDRKLVAAHSRCSLAVGRAANRRPAAATAGRSPHRERLASPEYERPSFATSRGQGARAFTGGATTPAFCGEPPESRPPPCNPG